MLKNTMKKFQESENPSHTSLKNTKKAHNLKISKFKIKLRKSPQLWIKIKKNSIIEFQK
jgi:hypothetical protein